MIGKLLWYIIGYADFCVYVCGDRGAALLNEIKKVGLSRCSFSEKKIEFRCPMRDVKRLIPILKESSCEYTYSEEGLVVFLRKILQRKGLLAAVCVCTLMNFYLSNIIWSVRVVGCVNKSPEEVLERLSEQGIREGSFIPGVNTKKLVLDYLLSEDDVSWIHLNINGTEAIVEVTEREVPPNNQSDKKLTSNIVSRCDGVISRIDVYSGGKEAENGDVVQQGQLLISSFFETRASGQLLRRAKGSVFAKTQPRFVCIVSKNKNICRTVQEYNRTNFRILTHSFALSGQGNVFTGENIEVNSERINIGIPYILNFPFYLENITYRQNVYETTQITEEEAYNIFMSRYEKWKRENLESVQILNEEHTSQHTSEYYKFAVSLECIENIGVEVPFDFAEPNT